MADGHLPPPGLLAPSDPHPHHGQRGLSRKQICDPSSFKPCRDPQSPQDQVHSLGLGLGLRPLQTCLLEDTSTPPPLLCLLQQGLYLQAFASAPLSPLQPPPHPELRRHSGSFRGAFGGQLSPEHVADPEHVALPGALPAHGHGGHGLQPHEAPSTLQPAVVPSHHLALVQHWAQPRGRRGRDGGGRRDGQTGRQVQEGVGVGPGEQEG